MFEVRNYDTLMQEALENAPEGIDTRQGSIFYDAISGAMLKIAKLYADLDVLSELIYIDTTSGAYLDRRAAEYSLFRHSAIKCCYNVTFAGTIPDTGERFYTDGIFFILKKTPEDVYYLEAEEAGTTGNTVNSGTAAVPVNHIEGLASATFGTVYTYGAEAESDDDLKERLREKISGPSENGNRHHYRTWCEEIEGVGRAKIIPLWDGPNTVKGIIISPNGTSATESVVASVQEYIDPDDDEDGYGDGLGEGVANLGAHFTAVAPNEVAINIACNILLSGGATQQSATTAIQAAVVAYLKDLALNTPDGTQVVVRLTAIGALIQALDEVTDYNSLTLNAVADNITVDDDDVAVLGEVVLNVL